MFPKIILKKASQFWFFIFLVILFFLNSCQPSVKNSPKVTVSTTSVQKIDAVGNVLQNQDASFQDGGSYAAGTYWDCVWKKKDGLLWEVHTTATSDVGGKLRAIRNTNLNYNWYDGDASVKGIPSLDACSATTACDTSKFIAQLNVSKFCGSSSWRLPTSNELLTLVQDFSNPKIDGNLFPNTAYDAYWSSSSAANDGSSAIVVLFGQSATGIAKKDSLQKVRAVATKK